MQEGQRRAPPSAPASAQQTGPRAIEGASGSGVGGAAPPPALTAPVRSVPDRVAEGQALRQPVPRGDHARWRKGPDRADPLEILQSSDADRLPELAPIRYGRMLASPFAFYRGAAAIMAADLVTTPASGIRAQACGDCHLMNFGGFATPERHLIFDINDFDETLPAPWEWDVKRLAASFVLAGRSIGLSDAKARDAAVTCVRNYRKRLDEFSKMDPLSVWYARLTEEDFLEGLPKSLRGDVQGRIDQATKRGGSDADFPKLTEMVSGRLGIRDAPPLIFHPEVSRTEQFQSGLAQLLNEYRETLADDRRELLDRYTLVDVAIKVVGIGSVGRRCWIALMMSASNDPLFLQFKEAVASVLEPFAGKSVYPHHGQRVVIGQRLMQPASDVFLGWVTASLTGKHFYVRQLRDAKIKPLIETMDGESLDLYAKRSGWALARAHAKGGDAALISGYLGASDNFDVALGDFSIAYADQTERDHAMLKSAVRKGQIAVHVES
jgi:uncharacterized protein (DUF2252 family)